VYGDLMTTRPPRSELVHRSAHMETWQSGSAGMTFPSRRIDVWRVCLDDDPPSDQGSFEMLSPDEVARAASFHFDLDRSRFVRCRSVMRILLSRYLATSPGKIRFRYGNNGKPELADLQRSHPLRFSVSHSEHLALIAVTSGRAVGVDVEKVRAELESIEIAKRLFSECEVRELLSLPAKARQQAFFTCWTRKEALLKATGEGLSRPLSQVPVLMARNCWAGFEEDLSVGFGSATDWSLMDMKPADEFLGALAFQGSSCRIDRRCWYWS
jgi:4'-phosphopantetheinyl transferase